MKIGLEWEGRTVWFRLSMVRLALSMAAALRQQQTPHRWRFKR